MIYDWIIYNGTAVTMNSALDILPDALICISGDQLRHVSQHSTGQPLPAARKTLDARGGLILPGLINGHSHLPMTLFRGLADDLPLMEWLNDHIFPAEARYITPETVYDASLLGCIELLKGGVTTVCDGYFYETEVARALEAAGLRAIAGQGVIDFPAPGVPDPSLNVEKALEFITHWQFRTPLITPSIFCHSAYTCSAETLIAAHAVALNHRLRFQIHISETRAEMELIWERHQCSPVTYLERLGVLGPETLLIHGVWLDDADIHCLARQGCSLVHTPESNMKLACGIAPLPKLLEAGIPVALGTDSCASNNDQDLFQEMGTTARLHKVASHNPTVITAQTVLRMATRDGAAAIGLGNQIGSLEPGKQADLAILNTAQPHLTPLYHPESQIVYAARSPDVQSVMVAGRLLVDEGQLTHLDETRIRERIANLMVSG